MIYKQGRLIDHIHIHVSDLDRSRTFYRSVLEALGKAEEFGEGIDHFYCDELYIDSHGEPTSGLHIAFQANSEEAVNSFHESGIAAGGKNNGEPGFREYHSNYYAAFLLDPDGNNIEAVCDVGAERSSEHVEVRRSRLPNN